MNILARTITNILSRKIKRTALLTAMLKKGHTDPAISKEIYHITNIQPSIISDWLAESAKDDILDLPNPTKKMEINNWIKHIPKYLRYETPYLLKRDVCQNANTIRQLDH